MNLKEFTTRMTQLLSIEAPIIWINTKEEAIAEQALCHLAAKNQIRYIYRTSSTASEQLDVFSGKAVTIQQQRQVGGMDEDFLETRGFTYAPTYAPGLMNLLTSLTGAPDSVMVIANLQPEFLKDPYQQRRVYEIAIKERKIAQGYMPIVFISDCEKVPAGIIEATVTVDLPLMTMEENAKMIAKWLQDNNAKVDNMEALKEVAQTATGLTMHQVRAGLSDSIARYQKIDPKVLSDMRIETIKQCETLSYVEPKKTLDDIGGHDKLKDWVANTKKCMTPAALAAGVKPSKGYVALGLAGTGKTAMAEAIANYFGVPLVIFDLSRVMGGIVGQSEQTARKTFETINSFGRCVVLIDEIDKQLAGIGNNVSGVSDGGTIQRVFDVILQNLQNNKEQFYILTANDVEHLPAPLMRSGRIDKKWFFDFPSKEEREEIFSVYIKASGRAMDADIINYAAKATEYFTGAEIESVVNDAVRYAFLHGSSKLTREAILYGVSQTPSIYENNREEVDDLIAFSKQNNIPKTSSDGGIKKATAKEQMYLNYLDEALEKGA